MLEKLWKKTVRRPPLSLWAIPALVLWLISLVYPLLIFLNRLFSGQRVKLSRPVISVGNLTVGGSGKTPLVLLLASRLEAEGLRVGVVSSGYGRKSTQSHYGPGHEIARLSADRVGDEVIFLAERLSNTIFSIDRSKSAAAERLDNEGEVDLIIVDDGFQHHRLVRNVDIVAYDGSVNRRLLKRFPYGLLREPLSALKRAEIIVITRSNFARDIGQLQQRLSGYSPDARIYTAQFTAGSLVSRERKHPVKYLTDKTLFLFAGIGNFGQFKRHVATLCGDIDCSIEFSDHQVYDTQILSKIKRQADECGSDLILTTGKDWVKLGDFDFGRELYYLDISIDLDPGEEKLTKHLLDLTGTARQRTR